MAIENELKLEGGVPSGKLKVPPNSCIPSRAKIRIKRNSKSSNDIMDFIELSRETTRLRNEDQYLQTKSKMISVHKPLINFSTLPPIE